MDPAETIIRKCGTGNFARGVNRVSAWTGIDKSQVYRWSYAKNKGGADGVIPAQHHQKILDGARRDDIALQPEDFFARPPGRPVAAELPPKKRRREDVIVLVSGVPSPFAYINGDRVGLDEVKRHIRDLERDAA
jgi:hypothetical protein